ncbi:MAG: SIS domain-containing protein [Phycisphaerales bacterium]|nr:SIS domain-containing protein [Phycisphaerales bacterium]
MNAPSTSPLNPPTWSAVLREHVALVSALEAAGPTLDAIVDAIVTCLRAGRCVYILGNGGSAADAQHIAAELLGRFKAERSALPALALTTDSSTLTAIANDLGYERVFSRQLEGLLRPGDVVWALSTSGNSPNVIAAAELARSRGNTLIGFTGRAGGRLAPLCTHALRAPHTSSDRIQECHQLAYHYICERVEAAFRDSPPS